MQIYVYFFYDEGTDILNLEKIELDRTFEKIMLLWTNFSFDDIKNHFKEKDASIIVTIGTSNFSSLGLLPYEYRRRWLHFKTYEEINPNYITNCYIHSLFQMSNQYNPLLSVITTAYKSQHRIFRPYRSLLNQTFMNWEWIIVDDSPEDCVDQWKRLKELEKSDLRIRVFKSARPSGYIGAVKKYASGLARGEWLIELDHDDDIVPELFQWIVQAHQQNPDASFIFSDCIELHENSLESSHYGDYFALNFGATYTILHQNRFQHVAIQPSLNKVTASHIVGVPNHVRCWKTKFYHEIGGHNPLLPVADDYELILRTILHSSVWIRIPELAYLQYRNNNSNNFTFIRNQLIQDLVRLIYHHYRDDLNKRFDELYGEELPYEYPPNAVFESDRIPYPRLEKTLCVSKALFSVIIPTYNRKLHLIQALESVLRQSYPHFVVYIIGDQCPVLHDFMEQLKNDNAYDERIRWWNLSKNHGSGGAVPRNYALYIAETEWIAYLDDDNQWEKDHLLNFYHEIEGDHELSYLFSSMKVDGNDHITDVPVKGALDTSCVAHRRNLIFKYGLWKDRIQAGYAHDYEFFSRWRHLKWKATLKPTVLYSTDFNSQSFESIHSLYNYFKNEYIENIQK